MSVIGPKGSFLWGMKDSFEKNRVDFLLQTAIQYPNIATFRILNQRMHLVSKPEYIKQVLLSNYKNYKKGYPELKHFLGNGLINSEGDFWLRQRRLAQPSFSRERVTSFSQAMIDFTDKIIISWGQNYSSAPMELTSEMKRLSLGIMGETLFGKDLLGESKTIGDALNFCIDVMNKRVSSSINTPIWFPTKEHLKFKKEKNKLNQVFFNMIEERKQINNNKADLLSMLMETYDIDTSERMSDIQLRDEITSLITGGRESTAFALAWTIQLLSMHKDIENKVVDEINQTIRGDSLKPEHISHLGYLRQVIDESLRLYPPFWVFSRSALSEDVIGDLKINKGDVILISPYVMHHLDRFWENPEKFDPDRFAPETKKHYDKYLYMPFGAGPRICIGNHFALMEMQIVLAKIYHKFSFSPVDKGEVKIDAKISFKPKGGLKMKLKAR